MNKHVDVILGYILKSLLCLLLLKPRMRCFSLRFTAPHLYPLALQFAAWLNLRPFRSTLRGSFRALTPQRIRAVFQLHPTLMLPHILEVS